MSLISTSSPSTTPSSTKSPLFSTSFKDTLGSVGDTTKKTLTEIFTKSNIVLIISFLAIYFLIYFILGIFYPKNVNTNLEYESVRVTRIFDGLVLLIVLVYVLSSLSTMNADSVSSYISKQLTKFKTFAENPYSIFSVLVFIIVLYCSIYLIRIPMTTTTKPVSVMIVETLAIILFVALTIIDFFKYLLHIDILKLTLDDMIDWFKIGTPNSSSSPSSTTSPSSSSSPGTTTSDVNSHLKSPSTSMKDPSLASSNSELTSENTSSQNLSNTVNTNNEVFNIKNNIYTYDEAQAVCSIYGAKLATYDQIESAYNDGGEWCNYGWSDGQLALFPTQKMTWNALQKTDKTKNMCGRPGINGGYIKNKNARFGVNCFGKKPPPTDKEKQLFNGNIASKLPESAFDQDLKTKMDIWKKNPDRFLIMNSFNVKDWSEF